MFAYVVCGCFSGLEAACGCVLSFCLLVVGSVCYCLELINSVGIVILC